MELIFKNWNFFAHIVVVLLLYQQISGNRFRWYWFIILPLTFRALFFVIPPLAYIIYFFYLPIYSVYLNKYDKRMLDIFHGLYPIVVESLFGRVLAFYLFPILGFAPKIISTDGRINFLIEILIFPLYYYLTKLVKIDFDNLKRGVEKNYLNRFFVLINLSMIVYLFALQFLVIGEEFIPHALEYREHLVGAYVVMFFVMLIYLNSTFTEKLEEELLYQKDKQLEELSVYSQHIESLYDEIRSFRHDYINILTSIQTGIELKDIDAIQDVYQNVLAKTKKNFSDSRYDFANLTKITNPAVKSVISAKLLEAQNKGINYHIEVDEKTRLANMDTLDFITILSILLDNAIEATELADKPSLFFAIFEEKGVEIVIVENSTVQDKIDISNIFNRGFSSKGEARGIGLANVQSILDKYPAISIKTKSGNHSFKQLIEMRKI